jgi:hypothetical protein
MSLNGLNNNQNLLQAILNRVQEVENAAWTLLSAMAVGNATGDLLNKFGKLVGEGRLGRTDGDYQAAIRLRIRVNRSRGMAVDVIAVGLLASTNGTLPNYTEYPPTPPAGVASLPGGASWSMDIFNLPNGNQVASKLKSTRAAGTYGVLQFSSNASPVLVLDWSGGAQATATPMDWSTGGSVANPGLMSAGLAV